MTENDQIAPLDFSQQDRLKMIRAQDFKFYSEFNREPMKRSFSLLAPLATRYLSAASGDSWDN